MPPRKKYELGYKLKDKLTEERFVNDEAKSLIQKLDGLDVNVEYFQKTGFQNPIFVEKLDGLGIKMPPAGFDVDDVVRHLGGDRLLDAMDVRSQNGMKMTLADFVAYFKLPKAERKSQLYNVLSLEFSKTSLDEEVLAPEVVRQIDWIDLMWPILLKDQQTEGTNVTSKMRYPKVQKYCLMSPAECFTDFHIDLGGSSVWYHVLQGEKIFWLIPPTDNNLLMFQRWTMSGRQNATFFADLVAECVRVRVKPTNTVFLPSGWIHAVYTPKDSLVIGGNFLHSFQIPMQLNVYEIESDTKVSERFRFPFFRDILWYAIERYVFALTGRSYLKSEFRPANVSAAPLMKIDDSTRLEKNPAPPPLSEWESAGLAVLGDWLKSNRIRAPQTIADAPGLLKELGVVLEKLQIIADATRADFAAAAADLNASSSSSSLPKKVKAFSGVLVVTPQIRPSTGSPNAIAPLGSSVAPSASNSSASTSNSAEPPPASVAPSASNSAEPAPPAKRCRSADEIAPPALQADRLFSIPLSDPKAIGNPLGDPKAVRVLNIPAGDQKAVSVIRYSPGLTQAQNLPVPARDSLNVDTKTPPCFQPLPSVGCLSRTALTNDPFLSGLGNHFFVQWMMKQKK